MKFRLLPCLIIGLSPLASSSTLGSSVYGLDLDQDGLSDLYELLYPGATDLGLDSDSDGRSNGEEAAAGTDPLDGRSVLDFDTVEQADGKVTVGWTGVVGKQYQIESSPGLDGSEWTIEGNAVVGAGELLTREIASSGERLFLRLTAADTDSDGDGVTDWEESQAGTNPLDTDSDHDGVYDDLATLSRMLVRGSVVNVYAVDALASEVGTNPGSFEVVRTGSLRPLTVTFTLGGTATPGADYATSPLASVYFPLGATRATVTVSPVADAANDPGETVSLVLSAGTRYTIGSQGSATLGIEDASTPNGTGLFGRYYNNANTTYTDVGNFNSLDLKLERVDAGIDFNWLSAAPDPLLTNPDAFSVRWTGQLAAQYSETYTFYWQADRGGKVWVDNQLLVDQWNGTSGTEYSAPLALEAGRRYDVKVEYRESATTAGASARFSWSSASQAKQAVPANRLYPSGGTVPSITSPSVAVGLVGGPLSYTITASNAPLSFGADGLPAGLTFDPASGVISGTPTASAAIYFATISASNVSGTGAAPLSIIILETGGGVTRDVWTGLAGTSLQALPLHLAPATSAPVASFSAPADAGDNFGERMVGWLTPPATGLYTFFLTTADENAELWLSASDDPARKLKRCFVQNAAPAGAWNAQPTQKSLPVRLQAGRNYYIEGLRKEAAGGDQMAVGWLRPGQPDADAPSEVIPGYCLSPYVAAPPTTGQSTLYVSTLTPQLGAEESLGSGSAVMTLNEAQTEAVLYVQWANLTGPKTNWHVHDGAQGGSTIIFDFDTEQPDAFGGYHWTLAPVGGITVEEIRQTILAGTAYVNIHTALHAPGEIKGFLQPATGSRNFVPPVDPPTLADTPITLEEAARFLNQATFGLSGADADSNQQLDAIEELRSLGYAAWIAKQMDPAQTPQTLLRPQLTQFYLDFPEEDGDDFESSNEIWRFWWKTAITAPDQLRQRVAFALSQILVVSENGVHDENATALTSYHDLLAEHAFGQFRSLLEKVTLNYSMGRYLDMAGNKKPDPSKNATANENYAREIMQLFTIGLKRMHPDGTLVLGNDGLPVANYDQEVVVGLANNFTGWNGDPAYDAEGAIPPFYRWKYTVPMTLRQNNHHTGEKPFLDNTVIPARTDAPRSLADSHDVLFHHPNVGPFICRQLIQRLVTANPSPGYIYRVARKFDDDGTGVRGNLGAVVRAVLLDYEARATSVAQQPGYGHLREPVLRAAHVLRALHGVSKGQGQPMSTSSSTGGVYVLNPAYDETNLQQTVPHYIPPPNLAPSPGWDIGSISGFQQTPLRSPTVFNFFEPDYVYNGATGSSGLFGPEFQITAETTIVSVSNWYYDLVRTGQGSTVNWDAEAWETTTPAAPPTAIDLNGVIYKYNTTTVSGVAYPETPRPDTEGRDIQLDLTFEKTLAYDENALLDRLDLLLFGNTMSDEMRTVLRTYIAGLSKRVGGANEVTDRAARVADAVYLIVTGPDFSVQK